MSAPETTVPETAAEPTQADADALFASVVWLDWKAPPELLKKYEGMHVAILGEEIIDADRDQEEFFRRLDARLEALPSNRVLVRYIPTEEEAWRGW